MMILLLGAGTGLFLLGSNLRFSIRKDLNDFFAASDYAIRVQAEIEQKGLSFLGEISGVESIALVKFQPITFISPKENIEASSTLKLFPMDYIFSEDLLIKGALDSNCSDCLYINQGHLPEFQDHSIGDRIDLILPSGKTQPWKFAGVIKDVGALPNFYRFTQDEPNDFDEMALQVNQEIPLKTIVSTLEKAFAERNIPIKHLSSTDRTVKILRDHLDVSFVSIQVLGGGTIILGLVGLMLLIALILRERTQEIGVLKAIGADDSTIRSLVGLEISIITIIGSLLGVCLAIAFTPLFSQMYGEMLLHTGFGPALDLVMISGLVLLLYCLQYGLCRWYLSRKLKKKALGLMFG